MDAFIATILPTGFNFNPYGWQLCWGQQVNVNQYQAVFSLLANYYGGDGKTSFGLPDLRGRVPIGWGAKDGGNLNYAIGTKSGNDAQALSISQMPVHSHTTTFAPTKTDLDLKTAAVTGNQTVSAKLDVSTSTATSNLATAGTYLATTGGATTKIYAATSSNPVSLGGVSASLDGSPSIPELSITVPGVVTGGTVTVGTAGGGAPVDIRPSSQAINFIICMNGIYPTRE
ncbi:phage tail protein [Agrobacterium bohemicum]|uniref:Phage tail collar domain-containing protein n=1 Tax=Agrobacterium bohemicum TaxID=2052828 RepID=A0A135P4F9_9HYPH|nr:tail fiber protein [Agrobacterium bohemicum]KXG86321.1 hypothetical protein ATO67_22055 [Agrobacterium bohemicum]